MIHVVKGNLLTSDCTIIAHQCNTKENMGAGIAKQIAKLYPKAEEVDKNYPLKEKDKMGKCSAAKIKDKNLIVVNLYAQLYPGKAKSEKEQNERYIFFRSAVEQMLKSLPALREKGFPVKIGMPYLIASDLAGGSWSVIEGILKELTDKYDEDIYLYQLNKK